MIRKHRASSAGTAEVTRSGYVYIISNMVAFGPDMVTIGLTRRLDPTDRVRELGDASVPFFFDTHAIIYSDEAPAVERALQTEFAKQRVNATNMRKEFFRVSLDQFEEGRDASGPGRIVLPGYRGAGIPGDDGPAERPA